MSDWIEWTGGENPVPGQMVEVRFVSGIASEALDSECFGWDRHKDPVIAPVYDIIAYRPASPPADQPADHIGEVNEMVAVHQLTLAANEFDWREGDTVVVHASDLRAALSLIARQQETIRADGEFATAYDALRAAWSFRQACALHADDEKYRWACEKFDAAFDVADQSRARLSAHQPKEPK